MRIIDRLKERRNRFAELLGARASGKIGPSYALRATLSAMAALLVCRALQIANPIWAVVSSVVVVLPSHRASVASAALRVIANLVGAGVGAAIAAIGLPAIAAIIIGLLLVAALCRLLAIDGAARSASVALIIVSLKPPTTAFGTSETRIIQVLLGCFVAFTITVIASAIERRFAK